MAQTTNSNTIVIIDDEPFNIEWLFEYLRHKGYKILSDSSVSGAVDLVSEEIYRALIIDLNIPITDESKSEAIKLGAVYQKFPGLLVAKKARNYGYRDRQVIIYSVHKDIMVDSEAKKIGCTYILKGRPSHLKEEIDSVLSYDPTQNDI